MRKNISIISLTFCAALFLSSCQSESSNPVSKGNVDLPLKSLDKSLDWDINKIALEPQEILSFLDLDQEALKQVKAHFEQQHYQQASLALLEYYRLQFPRPKKETLSELDLRSANLSLKHYLKGNKSYPELCRGEEIDWVSKATYQGKMVHDAEWLFQFHRFNWWPALARSYYNTGDTRYFDEWQSELNSYITKLFPIEKSHPWFIRRGMECENRNRNLIYVFPYFIHSKEFTPELLLNVLYMQHHQTEQIRKVHAAKGNHLLADLDGVLTSAITFPEFKKSAEWTDEVLAKYPQLMDTEIFEDGMNKELVFSYHLMYIHLFTDFYKKLEAQNLADRLPQSFHERLEKMYEIYAYQAYPDMTYCQFGDAWKKKAGTVRRMLIKHHLKAYPENTFYQYLASSGKKGKAPKELSKAYPVSGFYFLRSGWDEQSIFMPIKANDTSGAWHNNIDNGTFGLYAYGRNFMNDSGSYIYNSDDPKEQALRAWFRSSVAHQTMTLDRKNIQLKAKMTHWENEPSLSILTIENQSYPELTHQRTIAFIDQEYFLIHDKALGSAKGELRLHFQLTPSEIEMNQSFIKTKFKTGPNLHIHQLNIEKGVQLEKEKGLISYEQKKMQGRPAWALQTIKKSNHEPQFFHILEPLKEGQKASKFKVIYDKSEGKHSYTIYKNGIKKIISFMADTQVIQ
ncbi:alginate lyase family protein [Lentisphaera profundi]|uniref:Alginate lyase family protein n=1 Tax=Lentisphaera profundi TaxID=1658616 RepID=A0ABY7VNH7_9BACT|nr:alginate lyase family protein [Lentisphaera profundi]WDE95209.1 alginate lyase family protein [Lentisphaera profundi]